MANAIGMSRRLLTTIADYVRWRGVSTFHEFFPQTLSINLNMTVVSPIELETLVYRKRLYMEWYREQTKQLVASSKRSHDAEIMAPKVSMIYKYRKKNYILLFNDLCLELSTRVRTIEVILSGLSWQRYAGVIIIQHYWASISLN